MKIYEDIWKDETERYKKRESEEIHKIEQFVAQANIAEAQIREVGAAKTNLIYAESRLANQRIQDNINRLITAYEAGSNKFSAELVADTKANIKTRLSEIQLTTSVNEKRAIVLLNEAEGKVSTMLQEKRKFKTKIKELELFSQLSENDGEILLTENDDEERIRFMMLADSIMHNIPNSPDGVVLADHEFRKDELLRLRRDDEPKRNKERTRSQNFRPDPVVENEPKLDRSEQLDPSQVRRKTNEDSGTGRDHRTTQQQQQDHNVRYDAGVVETDSKRIRPYQHRTQSITRSPKQIRKKREEEESEDDDDFLNRILS